MELTKNYQESEKKIKEISKAKARFINQRTEEQDKIHKEIDKKIYELETQDRDQRGKIEETKEKYEKKAEAEIDEQYKAIAKVNRILYFLKVNNNIRNRIKDYHKKEWLAFDGKEIKAYKEREIKRLGTFYKDDYLKINLFIVENDKPKNKYSLVAVGRCFFGDTDSDRILKLPYHYGVNLNTAGNGYSITATIRSDTPTIREQQEWLNKNKSSNNFSLNGFLQKYKAVKQEYEEVINKYSIDDFKALIKHRCSKCGFFLTERQSDGYSIILREKKCPNCDTKGVFK